MRGVDARLHVDTRLRVQVNTASAQVASFEGVLRAELVLHAEIVLDGIGVFLVDHDVVGGSGLLSSQSREGLNAARAGQDPAVGQEIIDNRRLRIVDRAAQLRRERQNADVVVQDVVAQTEAGADGGVSALARRPRQADARHEVGFGSAGLAEVDQAGNTGGNVQLLGPFAEGNGGVFVAQAEANGQIAAQFPTVAGVPEDADLVAIIGGGAQATFGKIVWINVAEVEVHGVVVIIAARSLSKLLRRNELAGFHAEFERVIALGPGHVVNGLIEILNGELRSIRVGPDLQAEIEEKQVGETIQAREAEIARRSVIVEAIESDTQLVGNARVESMEFSDRSKMVLSGRRVKERGQACGVVNAHLAVVDVPAAKLILGRDVVVY